MVILSTDTNTTVRILGCCTNMYYNSSSTIHVYGIVKMNNLQNDIDTEDDHVLPDTVLKIL